MNVCCRQHPLEDVCCRQHPLEDVYYKLPMVTITNSRDY